MASGVKRMEMVGHYEVRHLQEKTGAAFYENQAVILSSNQIIEHGDNQDKEQYAGMAMKAKTGTAGTEIPVAVFKPGTLVRMSCYHATPASAVATKADIGKHVQIIASSGKTVADVANFKASNDADASKCGFIIVDVEEASTQYGRIVCSVKPMHCALYGEYSLET